MCSQLVPKHILTQPSYSMTLSDVPEQIVLSEDGNLLATLVKGMVEVRDGRSDFHGRVTHILGPCARRAIRTSLSFHCVRASW